VLITELSVKELMKWVAPVNYSGNAKASIKSLLYSFLAVRPTDWGGFD